MAREQPQSRVQLELPLAPSGDVEHFYAHLHQVLERDRFRGPYRAPDGAAAAAVQSRAARPQRAQHPARHLERRAGTARSIGARCARANERAELRVPRLCGDHAGGPRGRRAHGGVPDARRDVRQSRIGEPRVRRGGERPCRGGARAGGGGGGRASRTRSSGPRAPPRRTTWRFSALPNTTATPDGTSSPCAPSTSRCSIRAGSSSGAAGA